MFRNLILIAALVAVIWIVRGFIRRSELGHKKPSSTSKDMVRCEQCQTFLPRDDAVQHDGHFFCGQQHLEEWKHHN